MASTPAEREAAFHELIKNTTGCNNCNNRCRIPEDGFGLCHRYTCKDGRIVPNENYSEILASEFAQFSKVPPPAPGF